MLVPLWLPEIWLRDGPAGHSEASGARPSTRLRPGHRTPAESYGKM